eukprot:CAMPEP_0170508562 /NCGR_PEP_ID=MMETSP0208-20121228/62745_1 /TAXON_ID=197538 /ORGANISM="Strombidium inclinatum, Strain S3" /LENGTH=191 /DNA_ID=CAMNT_0010791531 /DNA_START=267 /DNA_END=844 /DNA_ORIENTATION=-
MVSYPSQGLSLNKYPEQLQLGAEEDPKHNENDQSFRAAQHQLEEVRRVETGYPPPKRDQTREQVHPRPPQLDGYSSALSKFSSSKKGLPLLPPEDLKLNINQLSKFSTKFKADMRHCGSPFRFTQAKKGLRSTVERRDIGEGRINKMFTTRTPTLMDDDIQSLIKQYPVPHHEKKRASLPSQESEVSISLA